MTGHIRPARPEDRAEIEQVVREAYAVYTPRIGRPAGPVEADYGALISKGRAYVLDIAGSTAGVLVLLEHGGGMLLDNVAVSPRLQGCGYGRRMVAYAEAIARSAGHRSLELYTNEVMTENLCWYGNLGFVETHRAEEAGYRRIYMSKAV